MDRNGDKADSFDHKAREWDQQEYRVRRAAEVAAKIRERVALGPEVRALDFGCGTGLLGFELAPFVGHMTFADTSAGMREQVGRKAADRAMTHTEVLDPAATPLPAGIGLIVSLMVLHHIDDARAQVRDLAGALKPGGFLCLADLDKEDGSFHAPDTVPHNGFHRTDIGFWVTEAGLTVSDIGTGFVNRKVVDGQEREFPVFLVTAYRAS